MFDIKESLKKWKQDLNTNQSLNASDVNELRLHLEDSMEELEEKGLSQEEAFWIARHRLGDTEALSTEYAKVNLADIWKKRILWILSGYFLIIFFMNIVKICIRSLYFFDIQWALFKTPLSDLLFANSNYTIPIPLYILLFLVAGSILFLLTRRKGNVGKNIINKFRFKIEKIKGYKLISSILACYIISIVINSISSIAITRLRDPAFFGSAELSGRIFFTLLHFFLFAVVIIFTLQLSHKKKKYAAV